MFCSTLSFPFIDADKEDEPTVTVTRSAESASIGNLGSDMIERGLVYGLQDERIPGSKIQALNAHEVGMNALLRRCKRGFV